MFNRGLKGPTNSLIMKTVKKCLVTLALLALGFSCSEPQIDPIDTNYEKRALTLTTDVLSISNQVRVLETGAELYLAGEVASCNLSEGTTFSIQGRIIKKDEEGTFDIRDGEFLLLTSSTGCNLWGRLEGNGILRANHFEISASVKSLCGNGAFECNGGELLLTIKGDNAGNQENRMTFTMEVLGSLHKIS